MNVMNLSPVTAYAVFFEFELSDVIVTDAMT